MWFEPCEVSSPHHSTVTPDDMQRTLLLLIGCGLATAVARRLEEEEVSEEAEESGIKFGFVLGLLALAGTFIFGYNPGAQ